MNISINGKKSKEYFEPWCDWWVCRKDGVIAEDLYHYLVECPQYEQERIVLIDKIRTLTITHNKLMKEEDKKHKIVEFIEDRESDLFIKQLLFPSLMMSDDIKDQIVKTTVHFVISTKKEIVDYYENYKK